MTEHSDNRTRRERLWEHAAPMVRELRNRVLTNPGRRASLRTAVGREPGDPRTFRAYGEVTRFLPERADYATERAFLAVAALICAQPRAARDADMRIGKKAKSGENESDSEDGAAAEPETEEADTEGTGADAASSPEMTGGTEPDERQHGGKSSDERTPSRSLGWSCAEAALTDRNSGKTLEPRLHAMCRMDGAGLHRQLPRVVNMLRTKGVYIDWTTLAVDLAGWDRANRAVTRKWLRDYHRRLAAAQRDNDNHESTQKETA
ncbi:CRISPR system Cascade subunit CasB [Actinopolyspora lacussalsi]|nr:CRISPR system Cascade subunit CasB [Actinopolyspora lacussalsi]